MKPMINCLFNCNSTHTVIQAERALSIIRSNKKKYMPNEEADELL